MKLWLIILIGYVLITYLWAGYLCYIIIRDSDKEKQKLLKTGLSAYLGYAPITVPVGYIVQFINYLKK